MSDQRSQRLERAPDTPVTEAERELAAAGRAGRQDVRTDFVEAMSKTVMGVAVIATDGSAGRFGLTVGSLTSVSADPPTLLVCVNRRGPIAAAIGGHKHFSVNILAAEQLTVAEAFAGRPRRGERFDFSVARWQVGVTGSPLLEGAAAWFDCALANTFDGGTHDILIGRVHAAASSDRDPLLYTRRAYGRTLPLAINDAGLPSSLVLSLEELEL